MEGQPKYGFLDKVQNIFYEIESKVEYERCLEFHKRMMLEVEERHSHEALNRLDDFADVIGDMVFNDSSSCFPELQEYEF